MTDDSSLSEPEVHTMLCQSGTTSCDEPRTDPPRRRLGWGHAMFVCFLFTALWAVAILWSATDAHAATWQQPYGGCEEATLAPHSAGAQECRDHGWTIMRRLAVNPHGVVQGSGLPPCTFEDGSGGPLPCGWNLIGIHTGNDRGLAYWIDGQRHIHYVWAKRPAPIRVGWGHWATRYERRSAGSME